MVQWLEKAATKLNGAIIFISHDRALLRKLVPVIRGIAIVVKWLATLVITETYLEQRRHGSRS